jgi:hypothetical protein
MVFFHEALKESLRAAGKFRRIQKLGEHSTVVVYRCDVE